jgi:sterol desaturase/sphingolipid hydroxylase (fatty acid hydroxylase superfamily)
MDAGRLLEINPNILLMTSAAVGIALELAFLRATRRRVDYKDSAHSVTMAFAWAGARLFGAKALMFGVWIWVWANVAPVHLGLRNPLSWLAYWLIGDFVYYWTHRAEHRCRILWSSHLVHHSSEQFNMTTAVRMPWTEVFYKPAVALWAPLLGFHPTFYVVFGALSLAVGQWQHLDWFPKVRLLDLLFSTPSNHRVHHARNAAYLDKNFGGSLMVWDRVFGTYEPEVERPVYGVLHRPEAATTLRRSLGGLPELWADMRTAGTIRGATRLAVGRP